MTEKLPTKIEQNLPQKAKQVAVALYSGKSKAIDIRRQLVELPEVANALLPVERHVFAASTKIQIAEIDDESMVKKTSQMFRFIAMDVGYNIPNDQTEWQYICTRLVAILKRYYSQMTLADVKLAFELSTVGELNEWLPKDSKGQPDKNHYQNFNADYFSKILNAYQRKQSGVINKAYKALPEPSREISPDEKKYYHNTMINDLVHCFLHYKYRGCLPDNIHTVSEMLYYEQLTKAGLAIGFEITDEERRRALGQIIMSSKVSQFEKMSVHKKGIEHERVQSDARIISRHDALIATFDEMIKDGIFIYDYIKYQ